MGFALDSFTLPYHTCDATPRLCGINTESAREPVGGSFFVSIFSVFSITLVARFPLDALSFPPHLKVCLQGAGWNLILIYV